MPKRSLWILLLLLPALSGCRGFKYLMYLFAPEAGMKTVEAEYKKLPGNTVAVVIFADDGTLYDYPDVRREMSEVISRELGEKVKDVTTISPTRVVKYQDDNVYWARKRKAELAKDLDADLVLFVSLRDYSMREPGSINLFRGRIVAEAKLFRQDSLEWKNSDIRALHPEKFEGGVPTSDVRQISHEVRRKFAEKLVRSFYKHKVPEDPEAKMQ